MGATSPSETVSTVEEKTMSFNERTNSKMEYSRNRFV